MAHAAYAMNCDVISVDAIALLWSLAGEKSVGAVLLMARTCTPCVRLPAQWMRMPAN
jgi:hypothetical protein